MYSAYIVDGVRSPIGKFNGTLASVRPDDLLAQNIKELVNRNSNIDTELIDDVIIGCANQAGEDNRNVARMSLLMANLPYHIPGETINRLCASGMSAVINASRAIQSNDANLIIAGGVENMTRAPFVMAKSDSAFSRDINIYDTSIGWRFINPNMDKLYGTDSMGMTAENLADKYNISREDQDMFAYLSQMKATIALNENKWKDEYFKVTIPQKKGTYITFEQDEFIKPDSNLEKLSSLRPAFKLNGTVTAGNSSGINDGSATLYIASENFLNRNNLEPLARIVSSAVVGVEPRIMGIGPVEASNKALQKAGLTLNDIDLIELNEAFAAQSLACIRSWGLEDNDIRINPLGGAIALGHPLGMSGARLLLTAANQLKNNNQKYALCTMCIGVGQGYATIIENQNYKG